MQQAQRVIRQYINDMAGDVFTYLQIGASDGKIGDAFYDMARRGNWFVIAVEPLPRAFKQLQENYADHERKKLFNVAIAKQPGDVEMFVWPEADGEIGAAANQASTFYPEVVLTRRKLTERLGEPKRQTVASMTLAGLVAAAGSPFIDFVHIDTEGHDYAILLQMGAMSLLPPIVVYERAYLSSNFGPAAGYMQSLGYTVVAEGRDVLCTR